MRSVILRSKKSVPFSSLVSVDRIIRCARKTRSRIAPCDAMIQALPESTRADNDRSLVGVDATERLPEPLAEDGDHRCRKRNNTRDDACDNGIGLDLCSYRNVWWTWHIDLVTGFYKDLVVVLYPHL